MVREGEIPAISFPSARRVGDPMLPENVPVPGLTNLTRSSREAEEIGCSLLPLLLCVRHVLPDLDSGTRLCNAV
jgi:hypothetical protein